LINRRVIVILPKEMIYRYMRHIIMPEISGPGQKKLLESCVAVFARSAKDAAPLMYYLVASGTGHIKYFFENNEDIEYLIKNWQDLNPDLLVEKVNFSLDTGKAYQNQDEKLSCRIVFGDIDFIKRMLDSMNLEFKDGSESMGNTYFIPTIFVLPSNWCGAIQNVRNPEGLICFFSLLNKLPFRLTAFENSPPFGRVFSRCLLGALAAIESIKLCLNLGSISENLLYFDLLKMEFQKLNTNNVSAFLNGVSQPMLEKMVDDIQMKISDAKVLIVGTGGLGSPAAYALALAGVGTIGLVDGDSVEISNLNRQILHSTSRIGTPKVKSAEMFLKKLNPHVNIITFETLFTKSNAMEIIKYFDVVIDGVDNLPTRYLLNDACFFSGKPLAEAGVLRFEGLGMTIVPNEGHCYRCVFPKIPPAGSIPSCSEAGILGPVPGVMGFIEAAEAVKIITGVGETLKNRLIIFDALDMDFRVTDVRRDTNCPLCGQNPSIRDLTEYEITCKGDAL
jgi:molybdopterin/thiamine biosynthesis adenylyltransferase